MTDLFVACSRRSLDDIAHITVEMADPHMNNRCDRRAIAEAKARFLRHGSVRMAPVGGAVGASAGTAVGGAIPAPAGRVRDRGTPVPDLATAAALRRSLYAHGVRVRPGLSDDAVAAAMASVATAAGGPITEGAMMARVAGLLFPVEHPSDWGVHDGRPDEITQVCFWTKRLVTAAEDRANRADPAFPANRYRGGPQANPSR